MSTSRLRLVVSFCAVSLAACGDDSGNPPDATPPPPPDAADLPDVSTAPDAAPIDAIPVMSITEIVPPAASRLVDTQLTVLGLNITAGASFVLANCDTATTYDLTAGSTVAADGTSIQTLLAADPTREQGIYTVTITNPDGQTDSLLCAFRILAQAPPTVTSVMPTTAFNGTPGDGVNSDAVVTILGTGFQSTPAVRWLATDGSVSYDALIVGFVSDTELTAVVPSETLHMPAGDYQVWVTNPDLLSAQWLVDDGMGGPLAPGVFTVTGNPPPQVDDVQPPRVENGSCTTTTLTITGGNFDPGATVWFIAPPGTMCAGSIIDANGNTLCPMVVDSVSADGMTITAHFDPCPGTAPWPIVVMNPDGQADTFFSVSVTPSSDGHLNTGPFEIMGATLTTARWKHAAAYGFDPFGNAYFYVAGGQDAAGGVLGSVETSQINIFGTPGPFADGLQYLDPANPRVVNTLVVARQGHTLVRVGRDLFAIGGATTASDVTALVTATASVERARILSYEEMPLIKLPTVMGAGLPLGSYYYQVSALGPWGESLPSREVVALNVQGTVTVCWDPPSAAGVTGYNVFRSLAPDGRFASAALIAANVAGPCFSDDGAAGLTPAPGNLRGSPAAGAAPGEGTHTYRVSAIVDVMGTPWETYAGYPAAVEVTAADVAAGNAAVQVTWDAAAAATEYLLYRWDSGAGAYLQVDTGGALAATTFLDAGAPVLAPGVSPRDEIMGLAPGSLSLWQELPVAQHMLVAREGLDGVAIHLDPMTTMGVVARILVAGGRPDNSGAGYYTSAESIGILDDGSLEPAWTAETPLFNDARVFYALLTTQGRNETDFPPPPEEPPCGDLDGDGFVDCSCAQPGDPADCNDADPTVHPGAVEICGDGIDQDCDMGCTGVDLPCVCTTDADMDLHISEALCAGDDCCDDGSETASLGCTAATAPGIHPGATEICDNGIDEDCDGVDPPCICVDDLDMDGHVSLACGGDDCCDVGTDPSLGCTDATDQDIHPGATEICDNGIDEDCDGFDCVAAPPPPEERWSSPRGSWTPPAPPVAYDLTGGEPVYVVAVFGDDVFIATNNQGRDDFEACEVDAMGHLACGATWVTQPDTDPQGGFGMDGVLYFSYLYPFYGVNRETIGAGGSSRTFVASAIGRFPVNDPALVTGGVLLGGRQSASTSFEIQRAYYQMTRLMAYVYAIGGWAEPHTLPDGTMVPEGPTSTVERHEQ